MADLWIFGDSYSESNEMLYGKKTKQAKYVQQFYRTKGLYPIHFTDILNRKFKFNSIHNYAIGGISNYTILEIIGIHIDKIKPNDYVCIGWSYTLRDRIVINNRWVDRLPSVDLEEHIKYRANIPSPSKFFDIETFYKVIAERDSILPINEVIHWQNILKKSLPENTLFWSPFGKDMYNNFDIDIPFYFLPKVPNLIREECNIEDKHYSSSGHEYVGECLYNAFLKLNKEKKSKLL